MDYRPEESFRGTRQNLHEELRLNVSPDRIRSEVRRTSLPDTDLMFVTWFRRKHSLVLLQLPRLSVAV